MSKGRGRARKTIELIDACVRILEEIQPATVRAVCYRLFVERLIPSMEKTNTNRVSRLLVQAREDGSLQWGWIVDETREAESVRSWDGPQELFRACVQQYRRDWEMTRAADKPLTVLYVGDRDPSGMHMSEVDLPSRLARYGGAADLMRVAIAAQDTTSAAGVPSFPAADKIGDARYAWYVENFGSLLGGRCAEPGDFAEPDRERDPRSAGPGPWQRFIEIEAVERESLARYVAGWPGISWQATK